MNKKNFPAWKIGNLMIGFAMSISALAQTHECADESFASLLSNISHEVAPIRASIEEISALTGVSISELEWATATDPLFTVIVEDRVIPYHEFGPEFDARLATRSGLLVTPEKRAVRIESNDGQVSRLSLDSLAKMKDQTFSIRDSKSEDAQAEVWWYLIPPIAGAIGGVSCWAASQFCWEKCAQHMQTCGDCGGECSCGPCATSPRVVCYTCPFVPPRDSTWMP